MNRRYPPDARELLVWFAKRAGMILGLAALGLVLGQVLELHR